MKTEQQMATAFRRAAALTLHYRHSDLIGFNTVIEEINNSDTTTDVLQALLTVVWHLTPGDDGEQVLRAIVTGCMQDEQ